MTVERGVCALGALTYWPRGSGPPWGGTLARELPDRGSPGFPAARGAKVQGWETIRACLDHSPPASPKPCPCHLLRPPPTHPSHPHTWPGGGTVLPVVVSPRRSAPAGAGVQTPPPPPAVGQGRGERGKAEDRGRGRGKEGWGGRGEEERKGFPEIKE